MKTKVLLHQLGRKDLVGWVNFELNAYRSQVGHLKLPSIVGLESFGQKIGCNADLYLPRGIHGF
jgi:hypothetical protein